MPPFIIAMPKSASTSLLKSLGEHMQIPHTQIFSVSPWAWPATGTRPFNVVARICKTVSGPDFRLRSLSPADDYPMMARLHSDVADFHANESLFYRNFQCGLFKQHFPPTPTNRRLLANRKKILLTRNVGEIPDAYRRSQSSADFTPTDLDALTKELEAFHAGWAGEPDMIEVCFHDLIRNTVTTLNRICAFLGCRPVPETFTLAKERYSR